MEEELLRIKNQAVSLILGASDTKELEELRIKFLGKRGELAKLIKGISKLPPDTRASIGQLANSVKKAIEEAIEEKIENCKLKIENLDREWIDVTSPGVRPPEGHLHLVTQAIEEISAIFERIGFVRRRYREVEWDWYAFEGLNMPQNHPARDEWETFFIDTPPSKKYGSVVLTPHTSSGQLREMEEVKPPIRMINISKCFRRQWDISHVPMFYQFEGLVVDYSIAVTHLKGVLDYFVQSFFGPKRQSRIRPFHFQFTEPSFEVDVSCGVCLGKARLPNGQGCKLCKEGWLELGGAGMVHPQVLKNGKIDPKIYTGFAFGWGVERTYMMKAGLKIDDIRLLYSNDLRFLNQF